MLNCDARKPTQLRPPLAVQPGSGGLPSGLPAEGLVEETSKPVWEYESPKVIRYFSRGAGMVLLVGVALAVEVVGVVLGLQISEESHVDQHHSPRIGRATRQGAHFWH